MMTPYQKRQFNTGFGGIFLSLGLLAWMLTVYFAISPSEPIPAPVPEKAGVSLDSCKKVLGDLGFQTELKDNSVTARTSLIVAPKEQLARASVGILGCKLPMTYFCMGDGCETPGISFVITKPKETASGTPKNP